jgi:hypothetical protein
VGAGGSTMPESVYDNTFVLKALGRELDSDRHEMA